jgi:hypothetical protein
MIILSPKKMYNNINKINNLKNRIDIIELSSIIKIPLILPKKEIPPSPLKLYKVIPDKDSSLKKSYFIKEGSDYNINSIVTQFTSLNDIDKINISSNFKKKSTLDNIRIVEKLEKKNTTKKEESIIISNPNNYKRIFNPWTQNLLNDYRVTHIKKLLKMISDESYKYQKYISRQNDDNIILVINNSKYSNHLIYSKKVGRFIVKFPSNNINNTNDILNEILKYLNRIILL